jgi:hypothetical protein
MWCKQFIPHIILVAAEGLWHLASLFYHDTQYSKQGFFTNLLLCDIPRNKAPCTGQYHIWSTYRLCPFFGREKNTDGSGAVLISLASACYVGSRVIKHFLLPNLVFQPVWGWSDLGFFQLPQSNSSPEVA